MAYEQNLGQLDPELLTAPEVSSPADTWEGESYNEGIDPEKVIKAGKTGLNVLKWFGALDDPIHWDDEPGMHAASNNQYTVVASTELTTKPKGSFINVSRGVIKPGDIIIEHARGRASNRDQSYVYVMSGETKGRRGWIKTGFLGHIPGKPILVETIRDRERDRDDEPAFGPAHGPPGEGVGIGPAFGPAEPQSKLPILPLLGIGYFLLK